MRIIQVIPDFDIGGIQKAGCILAEELARRGHETDVVARSGGPRYRETQDSGKPRHQIIQATSADEYAARILEMNPTIVHIHHGCYDEPLVHALNRQPSSSKPLIISTPVFGRPPEGSDILGLTKTCLIGGYMMYRLDRWLNIDAHTALKKNIAYVPVNSFEATNPPLSTLDDPSVLTERREQLGIPANAFVFGRIGRQTRGKWHKDYRMVIDHVLKACPQAVWLSLGFPPEEGLRELSQRWGKRFINFPQSSDYNLLARVYASMDVQLFMSCCGECFSTTICEAAGVGTPSIAFIRALQDNGQSEQIVEGVTGHLFAKPAQAIPHILRLATDPAACRALKQSTYQYAHQRWTTPKVVDQLLAVYDYWLHPLGNHPYINQMMAEQEAFAATYRPRMLSLLGTNPIKRLAWRFLLSSVENWGLFRVGRAVKRAYRQEKIRMD